MGSEVPTIPTPSIPAVFAIMGEGGHEGEPPTARPPTVLPKADGDLSTTGTIITTSLEAADVGT